jgi:hypothetical protein
LANHEKIFYKNGISLWFSIAVKKGFGYNKIIVQAIFDKFCFFSAERQSY